VTPNSEDAPAFVWDLTIGMNAEGGDPGEALMGAEQGEENPQGEPEGGDFKGGEWEDEDDAPTELTPLGESRDSDDTESKPDHQS
jgi:hypothetical protein